MIWFKLVWNRSCKQCCKIWSMNNEACQSNCRFNFVVMASPSCLVVVISMNDLVWSCRKNIGLAIDWEWSRSIPIYRLSIFEFGACLFWVQVFVNKGVSGYLGVRFSCFCLPCSLDFKMAAENWRKEASAKGATIEQSNRSIQNCQIKVIKSKSNSQRI